MWSGISQCLKSQHHLLFWHGMNQLEIDLSLKFSGLMIKQVEIVQKLVTLSITSLVWMLESITHSASLLWQQINQQKEKLTASHNLPVCKFIKHLSSVKIWSHTKAPTVNVRIMLWLSMLPLSENDKLSHVFFRAYLLHLILACHLVSLINLVNIINKGYSDKNIKHVTAVSSLGSCLII